MAKHPLQLMNYDFEEGDEDTKHEPLRLQELHQQPVQQNISRFDPVSKQELLVLLI